MLLLACLAAGWSDEIMAFVLGFRGCGYLTSGGGSRHFMATDSLVNVPALHEPWSLGGEGWGRHVVWMCQSGRGSLVSKCD